MLKKLGDWMPRSTKGNYTNSSAAGHKCNEYPWRWHVVTMLKYFRMCPESAGEELYECDQDTNNEGYAMLTFIKCPTLFYFKRDGDEKDIECFCGPGGVEHGAFAAICKYSNADMECMVLKLPPRKSKENIC